MSFTGGKSTGKHIITNAGLKKLLMELGGKLPVMIFDDCDYEHAPDAALFGIFSIKGERCTAGSRIFVQASIYEKFAANFAARSKKISVEDPMSTSTKVGALISKQHWQKVTGYIKVGIADGRDMELKETVTKQVFSILTSWMKNITDKQYCQIPFEMTELDPVLKFNKNNLHPLFT